MVSKIGVRPQDLEKYKEWLGSFGLTTGDAEKLAKAQEVVLAARVTEASAILLVLHSQLSDSKVKVKLRTAWKATWTKYTNLGVVWPAWLQTKFDDVVRLR